MSLLFQNDLITTLVPQVATGSATATYTRATTGYVQDFECVYRQALSGEARFQGARRVRNILGGSSNDLSNASWTTQAAGTGVITARTANFAVAPDGSTTASRIQLTLGGGVSVNDISHINQFIASTASTDRVFSIWLKSNTVSSYVITLRVGSTIVYPTITPSWQRFSVSSTSADVGTQATVGIRGGQSPANSDSIDILAWGAQEELTTGQANKNPSEIVSIGVLATPYHGANVDGVKYFSTFNANTVASNVVTEATGANINLQNGAYYQTNNNTGPFGYLAETARTNSAKFSQAFTNAGGWTGNGFITVTDNAAVAPDGTTTAATLQDTSITQFGSDTPVAITISADSNTHCISLFIKKGSNPGFLCGFNASLSGGSSVVQNIRFNPETGGLAAAGGGGVIDFSQTYWRVYFLITNNGGNTTLNNAFFPCTGLAGASDQASGIGTQTVWGYQVELNASYPSSYIPTTTVAVTRNVDVLSYVQSGNLVNSLGSAYAEYTYQATQSNSARIIGSTTGGAPIYQTPATGTASIYDRTNLLASTATVTTNTIIKGASNWTGSTMKVVTNGATVASGTFDGDMNMTDIRIGTHDGATVMPGTIRNVRIYDTALTDTQLQMLPTYLPSQITGANTVTGLSTLSNL